MKDRRNKFDLEEDNRTDLYGGKTKKNDFENLDNGGDDDFFGAGDDMENDPGYQRLDNGMGVNDNTEEMKKQNQMIAKMGAMNALGQNKDPNMFGQEDSRSMSEYYSELFSYAPAILSEAMKNGNHYERFKLSIKFAFSIIHCMAL